VAGGGTIGGGNGGNPGGGGLDVPPPVLGSGLTPLDGVSLTGSGYTWAIPGALFGGSFAIILIVLIAQAFVGMVMIPITRRVFRRRDESPPIVARAGRVVG
jgi:hypothetical protein